MQNESSIKEIIESSLQQIRTFIDADTIVGKQIETANGTVIIPISKLSMGFASGGLDLPSKKIGAKSFGGGGGTGVSVSPIGFLVISPEGHASMLPLTPAGKGKSGPVEQVFDVLDQAPDLIHRIMVALGAAKKTPAEEAEELAKKEAELTAQLEEELAAITPKSKKEAKEAKKAAKEAKKAARAAALAALEADDDEGDDE